MQVTFESACRWGHGRIPTETASRTVLAVAAQLPPHWCSCVMAGYAACTLEAICTAVNRHIQMYISIFRNNICSWVPACWAASLQGSAGPGQCPGREPPTVRCGAWARGALFLQVNSLDLYVHLLQTRTLFSEIRCHLRRCDRKPIKASLFSDSPKCSLCLKDPWP